MMLDKRIRCIILLFITLVDIIYSFSQRNCRTQRVLRRQLLQLQLSSQQPQGEPISVGIDLGTTFSAIAYLDDDFIPRIIPVPGNGRTMPSVVAFSDSQKNDDDDDDHRVLVGQAACTHELTTGRVAYRNVKRIIGTGGKLNKAVAAVVPFLQRNQGVGKTFKKNSIVNQLQDAIDHPSLLRDTRSSSSDAPSLLQPEVISGHVIRQLVEAAANHTGRSVANAVIGVPAYFTDAQRDATKKAAELCGIEKVKLFPEPEAAALAYGVGKRQIGQGDDDELVLVFDLGGGTYDVSMLAVGGGVTEIIFTSGNAQLGGTTFDAKIAKHFSKVLRRETGVVTTTWSLQARNNIVLVGEAARIHLSNKRRVTLALPVSEEAWTNGFNHPTDLLLDPTATDGSPTAITIPASNATHIIHSMDRNQLDSICADEFQELIRPLREVAIMAGAMLAGDTSPSSVSAALSQDDDDDSSTFADFYEIESGESPLVEVGEDDKILQEISDFEVKLAKKAQQGGRKKARSLAKSERKYRMEKRKLEVPSNTENVKVRDGITGRPISRIVLVGGATRMPTIGRLLTHLTGVVPQRTVNPDEAVALGCAVHAGILDGRENASGEEGEMLLNPMQSAILRAIARKDGLMNSDEFHGDDDDDDFLEFDEDETIEIM